MCVHANFCCQIQGFVVNFFFFFFFFFWYIFNLEHQQEKMWPVSVGVSIMKSGFHLVWCCSGKVDTHMTNVICTLMHENIFSLTYPEEEVRPCGTKPMLLPES